MNRLLAWTLRRAPTPTTTWHRSQIADVLPLRAGAGSVGIALLAVMGGHRAGRIGRLVRDYCGAGG